MTLEPLPLIDDHALTIAAPAEAVWRSLERVAGDLTRPGGRGPLTAALGTDPPAGFAIAESVERERLVLRGRHRFSRYELAFDLTPEDGDTATRLRATTRAAFPGLQGRVYRTLVIGTRLHVLATRHLLRRVASGAR